MSFENKRGNAARLLPEEQGVHFPNFNELTTTPIHYTSLQCLNITSLELETHITMPVMPSDLDLQFSAK